MNPALAQMWCCLPAQNGKRLNEIQWVSVALISDLRQDLEVLVMEYHKISASIKLQLGRVNDVR